MPKLSDFSLHSSKYLFLTILKSYISFVFKLQIKQGLGVSFILLRSIKRVPGPPGDLVTFSTHYLYVYCENVRKYFAFILSCSLNATVLFSKNLDFTVHRKFIANSHDSHTLCGSIPVCFPWLLKQFHDLTRLNY